MLNIPILKQDFVICRKTLLVSFGAQLCSLILGVLIRNMRLIEISDIFWDTIPVVIIPMVMQFFLADRIVKKRETDKSMDFLLSASIKPDAIIGTKALFMMFCVFLLLTFSLAFGCLTHVYDLTGVWSRDAYIVLNVGGMCLQLFTGGWCFLICCAGRRKKEAFYWGAGAGLLVLFYLIYLIYFLFPQMFFLQYLTVFSLFQQAEYAAPALATVFKSLALALLGLICFLCGGRIFCKNSYRV